MAKEDTWIYNFENLTKSIHDSLSAGYNTTTVAIIEMVIVGIIFMTFFGLLGLVMVYVERKVCAFFQQRLGPMRVGKWGTLQTIADMVKLLTKEALKPRIADGFLFNMAPYVVLITALMAAGSIPFAKGLQALDFNIGVLYVTAISSIGVIGILLAGWASNNKYSLIAALRSGAQVVSYELSVGLSILTIITLCGSLQLSEIIESQQAGWWIWRGHIPAVIAFIIFMIASTAETNRGPFDLVEAESELTAGFHTEYSGMKFSFFFLAEYANLFIVCAIGATVFLGGWMPFHFGAGPNMFNQIMDYIPPIVWFFGKVGFLIFIIMWFRWTFPRLRIDQLLTLEWKYLLPVNLVNILVMAFIVLMGWHL